MGLGIFGGMFAFVSKADIDIVGKRIRRTAPLSIPSAVVRRA
jgi:hypothetical protein